MTTGTEKSFDQLRYFQSHLGGMGTILQCYSPASQCPTAPPAARADIHEGNACFLYLFTERRQVLSISAIIMGVASTSTEPLPICFAVYSGSTTASSLLLIPVSTIYSSNLSYSPSLRMPDSPSVILSSDVGAKNVTGTRRRPLPASRRCR